MMIDRLEVKWWQCILLFTSPLGLPRCNNHAQAQAEGIMRHVGLARALTVLLFKSRFDFASMILQLLIAPNAA